MDNKPQNMDEILMEISKNIDRDNNLSNYLNNNGALNFICDKEGCGVTGGLELNVKDINTILENLYTQAGHPEFMEITIRRSLDGLDSNKLICYASINQGSFGFEIFDVNDPVKYNFPTYNLSIYACHYKDYEIDIKILS
jgi:hypothetical protein